MKTRTMPRHGGGAGRWGQPALVAAGGLCVHPRVDVIELTRTLVNIPSVTNDEGAVAQHVIQALEAQGWHVRTQEIAPEGDAQPSLPRLNVLALADPDVVPQVVLTTHLDTVPPFIACTEDDDYLYGRGTCDAKGIFAAQWCAAERLRQAGHRGVALLGVVGEETDSWGAKQVKALLPRAGWLVDGEPTQSKPASGAKGILALTVRAKGRTCHAQFAFSFSNSSAASASSASCASPATDSRPISSMIGTASGEI